MILALVSIFYFFLRLKTGIRAVLLLLAINLMTLAVAVTLFRFGPSLEVDFKWHLKGYMEVVELVEQGEITPDDMGLAEN